MQIEAITKTTINTQQRDNKHNKKDKKNKEDKKKENFQEILDKAMKQ